jgi:hypothetical protein
VSGTFQSLNCDLSAGTGCKPNANVVVDGDQGASVFCQVIGGAATFEVTASITQADVSFNLSGALGPSGGKAFVSSTHAQHSLQDPACDITIEANRGQIMPGAVWAAFNCTQFGDRSIGETSCTASGKFIFENCIK